VCERERERETVSLTEKPAQIKYKLLQVIYVLQSRTNIRSRNMSKAVKIKIYKTMVKPVAVYGSETWPMTEMDMKRLSTWKRKILRNMENKN
jgi:hypothetical protein